MEIQVNSSHIDKINYEMNNPILTVYFKGGSVYNYYPVYESQVLELLESNSKGDWFNKNIKNNPSIRFKKTA